MKDLVTLSESSIEVGSVGRIGGIWISVGVWKSAHMKALTVTRLQAYNSLWSVLYGGVAKAWKVQAPIRDYTHQDLFH